MQIFFLNNLSEGQFTETMGCCFKMLDAQEIYFITDNLNVEQ